MRTWQLATIGLVLAEGIAGLWISVELNAPPGATVAVLGGAIFAAVALWTTRRGLVAAAAGLALLATGCGTATGDGGRPQVVATTTIVADLVRNAGGDAVSVHQLLQPNTDPHDYEPRPRDVRAIADADLVLASGLGLDRFIDKAADSAGSDAPLVRLGDAIARPRSGDPHWWQDPRNTITVVTRIARELERLVPSAAPDIRARAAAYVGRLRALDRTIAGCIATVPAADRKLVTDHDAFGYFARRYGLEVVGTVIPATNTQAQPNAGALAALSRTIRREHVEAVFPEEALAHRQADAIARQTGATATYKLYGDALGARGSAGATYLQAMAHNADRIVRGLTGGARGCGTR
jgi:ABC-type Zn uptake system ZnuABC Zn-binding protein ZnuA